MRTAPVIIEGLAGPVEVTTNLLTGKHSMTVGGQPTVGTRRGHYTLPTADGQTVAARLRASLLDPYPTIEIAGVRYRTGPGIPLALRILALLPFVLVIAGGLLGGVIAAAGLVANFGIARGSQSTAVKAIFMLLVLAGTFLAYTAVVALLLL
ncbi:hypothetical protein [Micromonospora sp. NBC_01796]|uniref:hypothetical protein n=1 Tax=Micromonospora sp. NBC_01796 TaxID=2975987 RepID=UPI002DD7B97D|nr:hypothetical protein [Micromonospora sp. NBC_01796]WSA84355.1 hypothetical protein OIE47_28940 [Micromonospora sp. NBC_01796]